MSKTWILRIELQRLFKTLATNAYYEDNQEENIYPRIIFELSETTYDYGKTIYMLEVNVIDYGTETKTAEYLADDVQAVLNKYYFMNDEIQFVSYKGPRQRVVEDDKLIIRRRLLFEIHLHELKGE